MANISTTLALSLTGTDKTAGAFDSLNARAKSATAKLQGIMGGALGLIGGALAIRNIKGTYDALGELSDQAQRAGASARFLSSFSATANLLGITGVNTETLTKSMNKMSRETGLAGEAGFRAALNAAAGMTTEMQKSEYLAKTFGRDVGMNFLPLVRNGVDGVAAALDGVNGMMPQVSDAAATAGDNVSDSLSYAANYAKVSWKNILGNIADWIQKTFGVDVMEATGRALAWVSYGCKVAWSYIRAFSANIGIFLGALSADWSGTWTYFKDVAFAALNRLWEGFKSLGRLFAEFGKQIWSMLKGEGFNWNKILDAGASDGLEAANKRMSSSIKNLPPALLAAKFEKVDLAPLQAERDKQVKAVVAGVAAIPAAATARVVGTEAKKAIKAIQNAAGKTIDATTYEAFAATMRQGKLGIGIAMTGERVGAGAPVETSQPIFDRMAVALDAVANRLSGIDSRLQVLEAV